MNQTKKIGLTLFFVFFFFAVPFLQIVMQVIQEVLREKWHRM